MTPLAWIVITVLGLALASTMMAYYVIILIVGYNLSEDRRRLDLIDRYVVNDEISTTEFLELTEGEWRDVKHAPLK